jgi:RNA polymerase sigma-70 factor (ECF subfamily)
MAEEVVSEVFLAAWRRLADLPEPELPWLLGAARNIAANHSRAAARQQSLTAELLAWTSEAEFRSPDIADQIAERQAVLAALASLSDADRELLTLVAWQGLTPGAAARVVGCATAAYFVRLHRARRRLERALRDVSTLAGTEAAAHAPDLDVSVARTAKSGGELIRRGAMAVSGEEDF